MDIKNADIYTDLDIIPIYNFDKCINGDLKYLFVSKKQDITKDVTSKWNTLYNKYCELTVNSETSRYYRLVGEIKFLENRLVYVPQLINIALKTPKNDVKHILKEIRAWKLPINIKEVERANIEKVLTALNNSKTKLKRKLEELEGLKKDNEQVSSIKTTLQSQAVKIHKMLGVKPNIFEDSVTTWLAYWDEIKELSKKK